MESNVVTSNPNENNEDVWDAEAFFAIKKEDLALKTTISKSIDHENDWIVDSGCANHMTGDKQKLQSPSVYKGSQVVVTTNDSRLPIAHIGKTAISLQHRTNQMSLQNVYHVLESAYVEKTKNNKTADLWHMRLAHAMIIKEKGGNVVTLQLEGVIPSRYVVFDETSSWWFAEKEILPDQTDLRNKWQITYILSSEDANVEQGATHSFRQSIVH
ncbi:hypothetical protein H5410_015521 [Solanum commersonii]|uniref:Retrovirus-related Pol polyprotein from transposon TNT 1-94-like beta-barrel domain-containing protein n=1 Tax=Solanum commersonii TaxID=4109 RepID=A0A9J5ZU00_SOLCO|nr:hypothetical protein H5410_015521 [Solanum commersonii]